MVFVALLKSGFSECSFCKKMSFSHICWKCFASSAGTNYSLICIFYGKIHNGTISHIYCTMIVAVVIGIFYVIMAFSIDSFENASYGLTQHTQIADV